MGPPLAKEKECEDFLAKYSGNGKTVSGPYLQDGRWVVELMRKFTDAVEFMEAKIKDGGRNVGAAELISKALKEGFELKVNTEIVHVATENPQFNEFITDFLNGKPFWLQTIQDHE